jgi:hypothetical protein
MTTHSSRFCFSGGTFAAENAFLLEPMPSQCQIP